MREPPVAMAHIGAAAREAGVPKTALRHALGRLNATAEERRDALLAAGPVTHAGGRVVVHLPRAEWDRLCRTAGLDPTLWTPAERAHALAVEEVVSDRDRRVNTPDDSGESGRSIPVLLHG